MLVYLSREYLGNVREITIRGNPRQILQTCEKLLMLIDVTTVKYRLTQKVNLYTSKFINLYIGPQKPYPDIFANKNVLLDFGLKVSAGC